jgi:NAD(P)-dependent dehydrogenase (short-subunit alcohol dehydrogenase family)
MTMPAREFDGRVALVTGGGKGIGRAISELLAARGAHVAVNFRVDGVAAQSVVDGIVAAGGVAVALAGDVGNPDAASDLVAQVRERLGAVELLVNNAAYSRLVPPAELDLKLWRRFMQTNVDSAFVLTWLVKDEMAQAGRGAVVNISSTSSLNPDPSMIAYGASKAALNHFTASAAAALAPLGIRVNAVAPGMTRTPRLATVDEKAQRQMLAGVPMGRMAEPAEIAAVVRFLLSDEASYLTGQTVVVGGGI